MVSTHSFQLMKFVILETYSYQRFLKEMLLRSLRRFKLPLAPLNTSSTCPLTTKAQESNHVGPRITALAPVEIQPSTPPRLAGKKFLPGSTGDGFPEALSAPTDTFPHAIKIEHSGLESMEDCVTSCRGYLEENLPHNSAVLIRNLPLKTAADFSNLTQGLGYKGMAYEGGAVERQELDKNSGTYTASDEPPEAIIEFHNEMAYSPVYPAKVTLFSYWTEYDVTPLIKSRCLPRL